MSPYPTELVRNWISKEGTTITIRPIRPEDREIEKDFVHQLSPRSKYLRFFSGLNELTPTMLSRFTCIEYDREMALIAVLKQENREIEIAVGRYVPYPDGKSCEFAIVVDDEWQNRGIGYQIMLDLIRIAKEKGFEYMKGLILSANREMIQLAMDLGFTVNPIPGDAMVVEAKKDLKD
jgi:Sortase and related acyltransferases